jgi:hypothetical protein
VAVGAGYRFTCTLSDVGVVSCFGCSDGNLGLWEEVWAGGEASESEPRPISGIEGAPVELGVGREHGCVRVEEGNVYCWGARDYGQLGIEPTGQAFLVAQLPEGVAEVALARDLTYARTISGALVAISLMDGTISTPIGDVHASRIVSAVGDEEGEGHSCALDEGGQLICWGSNRFSQLGSISAMQVGEATVIDGVPSGLSDVAVNEWSTIVLTGDGRVFLLTGPDRDPWINEDGLALMSVEPALPPLEVTTLGSGNLAVSDGSCVLRSTGETVCLLRGSYSTVAIDDYPTIPSGTVSLSRRGNFACFLGEGGGVTCSGYFSDNELGHGVACPDDASACYELDAQQTVGLEAGVIELAGGARHTCALADSAAVTCWGTAYNGALGDGSFLPTTAPVQVVGLPVDVLGIDSGENQSCAGTSCGEVYCWGEGIFSDFELGAQLVDGF